MPVPTKQQELRYTIHTTHGRVLETLVPLARAVEVVAQHAVPEQRRRREIETIKLRAGELTTVEGLVIRCFDAADHEAEPYSYTGVLIVRMRADDPNTARDLLAAASSAALEADPFIVAIEGTNVTRNPAPRRRTH